MKAKLQGGPEKNTTGDNRFFFLLSSIVISVNHPGMYHIAGP